MLKIKGQGYIFDNQIRKWFLSLEKDIPLFNKDIKMQRYYDNFCSLLLVYLSVESVIAYDDLFC